MRCFQTKRQRRSIQRNKEIIHRILEVRRRITPSIKIMFPQNSDHRINLIIDIEQIEYFVGLYSGQQHFGQINNLYNDLFAYQAPFSILFTLKKLTRIVQIFPQTAPEYLKNKRFCMILNDLMDQSVIRCTQIWFQCLKIFVEMTYGSLQCCQHSIGNGCIKHFLFGIESKQKLIFNDCLKGLANLCLKECFSAHIISSGGVQILTRLLLNNRENERMFEQVLGIIVSLREGMKECNYFSLCIQVVWQVFVKLNFPTPKLFKKTCDFINYTWTPGIIHYSKYICPNFIHAFLPFLKQHREEGTTKSVLLLIKSIVQLNQQYAEQFFEQPMFSSLFICVINYCDEQTIAICCTILAQMVTCNKYEYQKIVLHFDFSSLLLKLFLKGSLKIRIELGHLWANLTGSDEILKVLEFLRGYDIVKLYLSAVSSQNTDLVISSLANFERILQFGKTLKANSQNLFVLDTIKLGGLYCLQRLQTNQHHYIKEKSMQLLNNYFSDEVADEPSDESKNESFLISSYFNDSKDIIIDVNGEIVEKKI